MYGNSYMQGGGYYNANMGMAGMGAAMGMPMGGSIGIFNGTFVYSGSAVSLQGRIESITPEESAQIKDASLNITGRQIQQLNICCMVCTIIWGSLLIIPLFFMCCGWWRSIVYPAFDVPIEVYRSLSTLARCPNIANISLNVTDNLFNAAKAQELYQILNGSRLKSFTLVNMAGGYNYQDREYSDFEKNVAHIKSLPIGTDIRWMKIM